MQAKVTDNRERSRFELESDGLVSFLEYRRNGSGPVMLTHTWVPEALSGRGVGSRLVHGALDRLRAQGQRGVPLCGFVAALIERHPEYRDLVAAAA